MQSQRRLPLFIGALIALLCQFWLAPNIHILGASPNFVLAYIIAISVAYDRNTNYLLAFLLGLIYDLASSGPLGAMAFACVLTMFISSQINFVLRNDTLFIPVAILLISCYIGEITYALLMIACGFDVSLLDALLYQALPCGLYDNFIVIVAFVLVRRFMFADKDGGHLRFIDSRFD